MLTKIPFFKDVIVSSFSCEVCSYENSGLQSGGSVETHGLNIALVVKDKTDLNRQVVKSEYCTIRIPCLDFEQPPNKKGGKLNSIFMYCV